MNISSPLSFRRHTLHVCQTAVEAHIFKTNSSRQCELLFPVLSDRLRRGSFRHICPILINYSAGLPVYIDVHRFSLQYAIPLFTGSVYFFADMGTDENPSIFPNDQRSPALRSTLKALNTNYCFPLPLTKLPIPTSIAAIECLHNHAAAVRIFALTLFATRP